MTKSEQTVQLQDTLKAWLQEADLLSHLNADRLDDLTILAVSHARNSVFKVTNEDTQKTLYLKQIDKIEQSVLSLLSVNHSLVFDSPTVFACEKLSSKAWLKDKDQPTDGSFKAYFQSSTWAAMSEVQNQTSIFMGYPGHLKKLVEALYDFHHSYTSLTQAELDNSQFPSLIGAVMSPQMIEMHCHNASELLTIQTPSVPFLDKGAMNKTSLNQTDFNQTALSKKTESTGTQTDTTSPFVVDSHALYELMQKHVIEPNNDKKRLFEEYNADTQGKRRSNNDFLSQFEGKLLHGDLTHHNVFVTDKATNKVGFIDFEYVCVGNALWDLAMITIELSNAVSAEGLQAQYVELINLYLDNKQSKTKDNGQKDGHADEKGKSIRQLEAVQTEERNIDVALINKEGAWCYLVLYWLVAKAWAMQSVQDSPQPVLDFIKNYDSKADAIQTIIKLNTT